MKHEMTVKEFATLGGKSMWKGLSPKEKKERIEKMCRASQETYKKRRLKILGGNEVNNIKINKKSNLQ